MFKVIVAGSREFNEFEVLRDKLDHLLKGKVAEGEGIEIVSGGCRGVDMMGEKYARLRGYKVKRFNANWKKYGKSAGYLRNSEMGKYGDALVTFWDGKSKGTKMMIEIGEKEGMKVRVVRV